MIHSLSPVINAASIHPVWLMDEYVRIFRIDVWFVPPIDPTISDVSIIAAVKVLISMRYDVNIIGAAFWIVISSVQFFHLSPITPGNYQWRGAAPIFSISGVQMIIGEYDMNISDNVNSSVIAFTTTIKSSVAEADTWTRKYFSAASILYVFDD